MHVEYRAKTQKYLSTLELNPIGKDPLKVPLISPITLEKQLEMARIIAKMIVYNVSSALVLENFLDVENYSCESGSYITEIAINKTLSKPFACYAYAGFTSNVTFDAYKGDLSVPLWSPQHQEIFSTNNGNFEYMECGVLSGGPCDGDTIWNTGLWMATDQSGCGSSTGLKGLKGLYAQFEIVGKCASKCTLVNGELTASTPITNNGSAA
ncbi:unnamed protein product [Oppiella nova]|uniref:Uncharacterized protein n=1 Tax=Oppiella nova TaxID=334625 RepID=A0A7R9QPI7_9ACAR|nr:unnamed protein product [Oppiella nova]CAG2170695.1 unnamed protein product [Oppiella nova]